MKKTTVRKISFNELIKFKNFNELCIEYSKESIIGELYGVNIDIDTYEQLELLNVLDVYGAFYNDNLVGFLVTISLKSPHSSKNMVNVESLFLSKKYRNSSLGVALIKRIESIARDRKARGVQLSAPLSSVLETIAEKTGYIKTHSLFTKERVSA